MLYPFPLTRNRDRDSPSLCCAARGVEISDALFDRERNAQVVFNNATATKSGGVRPRASGRALGIGADDGHRDVAAN